MVLLRSKESGCDLDGRTRCTDMPRVTTEAAALIIAPSSLQGVEQRPTAGPLSPHKLTMQQYNSRVAIMVQSDDAADVVTVLPAYNPSNNGAGSAGVVGWSSFAQSGAFDRDGGGQVGGRGAQAEYRAAHASSPAPLYTPGGPEMASAVALRANVEAAASRTIRFIIAWFAPELEGEGVKATKRSTSEPSGDSNSSNSDATGSPLVAMTAEAVASNSSWMMRCDATDFDRVYHNKFTGPTGRSNNTRTLTLRTRLFARAKQPISDFLVQ